VQIENDEAMILGGLNKQPLVPFGLPGNRRRKGGLRNQHERGAHANWRFGQTLMHDPCLFAALRLPDSPGRKFTDGAIEIL
jgi:hypothetical protein